MTLGCILHFSRMNSGTQGNSGTDGTFSHIVLKRLVLLIMIGDFQNGETSRLSPVSVPTQRDEAKSWCPIERYILGYGCLGNLCDALD